MPNLKTMSNYELLQYFKSAIAWGNKAKIDEVQEEVYTRMEEEHGNCEHKR